MFRPVLALHVEGIPGASTAARMVLNSMVCPKLIGSAPAQVSFAGIGAPQTSAAFRAQSKSHVSLQQNGSMAQVVLQQVASLQPGLACTSKHGPALLEQTGEQPNCETSIRTL